MGFFWIFFPFIIAGAFADNYDREESVGNYDIEDNVTSYTEENYDTLQQRSGHIMEQEDSYKEYIPELTPGTLLCGAFMDTVGNLESSSEILKLKQQITRNLNVYHKQLYGENDQDVVLEILSLLKKLIAALEQEYLDAIKQKQENEGTEISEGWTDYHILPTEETLEIHHVSTEEPFPEFQSRLQTTEDISYQTTEESAGDFPLYPHQEIVDFHPVSTEEPVEDIHVQQVEEIVDFHPVSTQEPAEAFPVHQVQEIVEFQPTSEDMDEDFNVNQAEEIEVHPVFTEEPASSTSDYYEPTPTVSEILESTDEDMDQYSHGIPSPVQVGSIRGIPGVHFPDYTDIPITSFTCAGKPHVPGFYADMETGCQVFHVCYRHRRESFLCPVGTTFNQPILACDYWYSSNCSMTSLYYDANNQPPQDQYDYQKAHEQSDETLTIVDSLITKVLDKECQEVPDSEQEPVSIAPEHPELSQLLKFLPVKAKVTVYPESGKKSKIVAVASIGNDKRKVKTAKSRKVSVPKRPSVAKASAVLKIVEDTSSKVMSDIFKTASGVLKQVEAMSPKVVAKTESPKMMPKPVEVTSHKPVKKVVSRPVSRPLTTLNKKFIVKPVQLGQQSHVDTKTTSRQKQNVKTKQIPHLKSKHFEKILKSENPGYLISPLTKQTLASGYIRLLKLKNV